MFTPSVLVPWLLGLIFLAWGLLAIRKELLDWRGPDRLIANWMAFGPVCVAAPLAVFAGEHFMAARFIAQMVPVWMPARLFWAYFVGFALLAAAISLVTMKFVRLSATLLGAMFVLFVLMMHLHFALEHPGGRLGWIFVLRETAFAGGAWALAASKRPHSQVGDLTESDGWSWMVLFGRISMACAVLYFGVQEILHPEFAPGVPDTRLTPTWVPFHAIWGYPAGFLLVVLGAALLFNKKPRAAALGIDAVMTFLTACLFLPILALTQDTSQMVDAINYVADTLMFGATALLLARALSARQ